MADPSRSRRNLTISPSTHPVPRRIAYERLVNRSERFGCITVQPTVDLRAV